MSDPIDPFVKAHRNNIGRYRRLLQTHLTEVERSYVQSRLSEETSALEFALGQLAGLSEMMTQSN